MFMQKIMCNLNDLYNFVNYGTKCGRNMSKLGANFTWFSYCEGVFFVIKLHLISF